ncbi:nuclear pore protein-like protein [Chaetomidium leptoderma]|uniref:Nuclear pore protein-like protein n=1 Tax=Chaetomidium leptoderma TaxID=669021 RepID=A0AAN7A202_9PEZI|nr:nuclear pore protein-like protein [Chaetomidium leptoderma]
MDTTSLPLHKMDPRGDLKLRVGTEQEEENDSKPSLRCFLVCSRTLARVSPVFDRMLNGSFAEAKQPQDDGKDCQQWVVNLPDDKPSAMELFLDIAHGHLQKAPRALSMHELYDLTALTHFYDATPILVPWIRPWIHTLRDATSGPDDSDAVPKMIWISWVLGHRQMFEATVRRITMEGPGSMFAEGSLLQQLEMPSDIIERICAVRDETIEALLDVMRSFVELLTVVDEKPRWCRHATFMGPHRCESMILGSMTFCLTRASLCPIPEHVRDVEHSLLGLYEALSTLVIHDIGQPIKGEGDDHRGCNPQEYLVDQMKEVLAKMQNPVREADREQLDAQAKRLHMP